MELIDTLFAKVTDSFYLMPSASGRRTTVLELPGMRVSIIAFNEIISENYLRAIKHLETCVAPPVVARRKEPQIFEFREFEESDETEELEEDIDSIGEDELEDLSDFTILLLDSETTNLEMPDVELIYRPANQTRKAFGNEEGTIIATMEGENPALSIINFRKRIALLWLPSATDIPSAQLASPFRTIFNWILGDRGFQLVHAAAFGYKADGLLMSGLRGSGKTVTSLACLAADWNFLGDDFVVVGPSTDNSGISIYGIYNSVRLQSDTASSFNLPDPALTDDKSLYYLFPKFGNQLPREIPLSRIVMPTSDQQASSKAYSTAEVIREIMVPTLAYLPGREEISLRNLSDLLSEFPCHSVNLNVEIKEIPERLRRITVAGQI